MASTCLLKKQIEQIQKDFKDKNERFIPSEFLNMDGKEITEKLRPIVGENAERLSELIQEKIILKNRLRGIELLRDKINEAGKYNPNRVESAKEEMALYKQKNMERIMAPKEHESFLSSLAARITGFEPTQEQAKTVFDMSKKVEDLKVEAEKSGTRRGGSPELSKASKELAQYINSANEKPAWKSLLNTSAKAYKGLFIAIKTGVKVATSVTENSATEAIGRALTNKTFTGDIPFKTVASDAADHMSNFFKTGDIDNIRTSLDDHSIFGESKKGFSENFGGKDTIAEGPLKKVAQGANLIQRGINYFAINILHRGQMALSTSINFPIASAVEATRLANDPYAVNLGIDAKTIYEDARLIEPKTELGNLARQAAIKESLRVLGMGNTPFSEASINLQRSLNAMVPDLHAGDYALPMSKTPASIAYYQLENMGGGLGTGMYDLIKGGQELKKLGDNGKIATIDTLKAGSQMNTGIRTLIRTIGTIATVSLITANLTKKQFKAPDQYGNSYVKIGGGWVNTEIFGQASGAVTGIMMAKTGNDGMAEDYTKAGFFTVMKAPFVSNVYSTVQEGSQGKLGTGLANAFLLPQQYQDIQKSIQDKSLNPLFFGTLYRTDAQMKIEDRVNQQKSVKSRIENAKKKAKNEQPIF